MQSELLFLRLKMKDEALTFLFYLCMNKKTVIAFISDRVFKETLRKELYLSLTCGCPWLLVF
jgi:hypothetical protein